LIVALAALRSRIFCSGRGTGTLARAQMYLFRIFGYFIRLAFSLRGLEVFLPILLISMANSLLAKAQQGGKPFPNRLWIGKGVK
jgi:hypothetical protein